MTASELRRLRHKQDHDRGLDEPEAPGTVSLAFIDHMIRRIDSDLLEPDWQFGADPIRNRMRLLEELDAWETERRRVEAFL